MTPSQIKIALALDRVSTGLRPFNARLIGSIGRYAREQPEREISPRQQEWLYRLAHTYRRQLSPLIVQLAAAALHELAWQRAWRDAAGPTAPAPSPTSAPARRAALTPRQLEMFPAGSAGGGSGGGTPETAREPLA